MATYNMTSLVEKTPSLLSINRDPLWVNVPREVGDGMEADPMESISFTSILTSASGEKNEDYTSVLDVSSGTSSRSSSPQQVKKDESSISFPQFITSSSSLNQSSVSFTNSEKFLIEEKSALKDHLEIQIQVNQEVKKLLVASVGGELGYHYEQVATEKIQLLKEVDELKSQAAARKEEMERLEISCDIWRSKFLASRLQCDELMGRKRILEKYLRHLEMGTRGLLRDYRQDREHLHQVFITLCHMDAELSDGKLATQLKQDSTMSTSEKCRKLANYISQNLINSPPPHVDSRDPTLAATPAEKYVLQILDNGARDKREQTSKINDGVITNRGIPSHFFTPSASSGITFNCCKQCKGKIHII